MYQTDITKYVFKDRLALEFEIISLKQLLVQAKEFIHIPHRTNFYQLIWLRSGEAHHMIDFKDIHLKSGELLPIDVEMVHQFDQHSTYDGFLLLFTNQFFCTNQSNTQFLQFSEVFNPLNETQAISVQKFSTQLDQILQLIQAEVEMGHSVEKSLIIRNYLYNFLLFLERIKKVNHSESIYEAGAALQITAHFKQLVNQFFITQKQVNFYTDLMLLNEKKLNKSVQEIIGKTAKQIIKERIILEIKKLLYHSQFSIKEISYHLGFEEPTNFIKFFKKSEGFTPFEFRKKFKKI